MKSYFFVFVGAIGIGTASGLYAQQHVNSWFRATASMPLSRSFTTDIECQHRRQNDLQSGNPFEKNLMYAIRMWVFYSKTARITYAFSPFACFSNYKMIEAEGDDAPPTREYRLSAAVEWHKEFLPHYTLSHRTGLEYRIFEGTEPDVTRLRNRLSLRYDLNGQLSLSIGNELFFNLWGTDTRHRFDHDRLLFNVTWKVDHKLKFDLGYIYGSRLTKNNPDIVKEHNVVLQLHYTLSYPNEVLKSRSRA